MLFVFIYTLEQLLSTNVECAAYTEELLKIYSSEPVQQLVQCNKVSDIFFPLMYVCNSRENISFCTKPNPAHLH